MHEGKCETVKIASPDSPEGFIVINASDFDASKHKIYGDEEKGKKDVESRKGKKG